MALFSYAFVRKRIISLAVTMTLSATSFAVGPLFRTHAADATSEHPPEQPFLSENRAAMDKMMADMEIKPSGDVDRDFVDMMVPHHQGAIDMAKALLRYGRNDQLRRMAQEIIVTQQQEIIAMRLAVGEPLPPSVASPTRIDGASPANPGANSPLPAAHGAMGMSHGEMPHDSMDMNMK